MGNTPELTHHVGASWYRSASSAYQDVINPATGEAFAQITTIARAEVRKAIARAHQAFLSWRKVSAKNRGEWLQKLANELELNVNKPFSFFTLK